MKSLHILFALFVLTAIGAATGAPVVVTNPNVATETVDAESIKSMFRGKKLAWGNKSPVVVAVLKEGAVHEEFLKKAFNISPGSFSNYWRLTAMSGGATAPKEFSSEEDLLKFVAATPGAIGYVDSSKVTDSVHVVTVP